VRTVVGIFLIVPMFLCLCSAQQLAKRLILKDGTYQLATKWVVQGDRVRYFSAERAEWEEVPNSMVDWAATNQYEKERAEGLPTPEALKLDKELADQRAAEEAKRPLVAPGLRLPEGGGVFLLDTFQDQPELVPLDQKVVRGDQTPAKKNTVEIGGPHSDVQAHVGIPALFVKLDKQTDGAASGESIARRFQIARAQAKKDRRIVSAIRVSLPGKAREEEKVVPAKVEALAEGWWKIAPSETLRPGEYALVELPGEGAINGNMPAVLPENLWDFGVNAAAPANALAVKAAAPASASPSETKQHEERQP